MKLRKPKSKTVKLRRSITVAVVAGLLALAGCAPGPDSPTAQNQERQEQQQAQDRTMNNDSRLALDHDTLHPYDDYRPPLDESPYRGPALPDSDVPMGSEHPAPDEEVISQERAEFINILEEKADQIRTRPQLTESEQKWLDSVDRRIEMTAEMSQQLTQELEQLDNALVQEPGELEEREAVHR